MQIKQFRYAADNLAYLIYGQSSAIVIDGGAVDKILSFVTAYGLEIKFVTNTHTHADHTCGNKVLLEKSNAKFIDTERLYDMQYIDMENTRIKIYHTPGHTTDSFCFYFDKILISGDTLFNGKTGRCFSGDLNGFLASIKMLMNLPRETIIYAGHDYVKEYMKTAKSIDPDNPYIDDFLEKYDSAHVFSILRDEFLINPCLRFNDPKMITILEKKGLPVETEYQRWESITSIV